ncbi:hypothetical protein [Brevibacillus laterosporus]|uniref:hypothetical protein n=1 Tax=Brevibacillus laterosporus TaxID=1465 RepID=UPI003D216D9B
MLIGRTNSERLRGLVGFDLSKLPKLKDAMGMKEQAKYLGELADRVRIASGQEPQNK